MAALLLVLTPIALLDSASIIPVSIVTLIVLLAEPRPLLKTMSFTLGIFSIYVATGLLLLVGLKTAFDGIEASALRLSDDPGANEVIFQISLGLLMCAFGLRIAKARKSRGDRPVAGRMSLTRAFVAGLGVTFLGMPGGFPYFAAIDLILRADVAISQQVAAVLYYNIVFVAPLTAIVALRLALGERGNDMLAVLRGFIETWAPKVIVTILVGLGLTLVADGIGWFLSYPLIPL